MGPDGDPNYDARGPAVAFNPVANQYLVTWAGEDNTGLLASGEFEIYGQLLLANGTPTGTNDFRISTMGNDGDATYDAFAPAVAFDTANNQYLVVWEGEDILGLLANGEFEIFGQRLSAAGAPVGADDFRISDMGTDGDPLYDAQRPAVTYDGAAHEYLVVWEGDDNGTTPLVNGETEIWGQRIGAATGLEIGSNDFRLSDSGTDGDPARDAFDPGIAFATASSQFIVIWQADDDLFASNQDEFEIYGQLFANPISADVGDGINPQANDLELRVSPNPMRGVTRIEASRPGTGPVELSLVDVLGRRVLARTVPAGPSLHAVWDLDAAGLPGGVYLIRASTRGKTVTRKVVVAP